MWNLKLHQWIFWYPFTLKSISLSFLFNQGEVSFDMNLWNNLPPGHGFVKSYWSYWKYSFTQLCRPSKSWHISLYNTKTFVNIIINGCHQKNFQVLQAVKFMVVNTSFPKFFYLKTQILSLAENMLSWSDSLMFIKKMSAKYVLLISNFISLWSENIRCMTWILLIL